MPQRTKLGGQILSAVTKVITTMSSGNVVISSNVYGEVMTSPPIAAEVGDLLAITLGALWDVTAASPATCWTAVDGVTRVGGADVNYISAAGSGGLGYMGWFVTAGDLKPSSGTVYYTVQSGDIENGTVTVRIVAKNALATTRTVRAASGDRLHLAVVNMGP